MNKIIKFIAKLKIIKIKKINKIIKFIAKLKIIIINKIKII